MLTIEFKGGFIVVEGVDFPGFGGVAKQTAGYSIFLELPVVGVGMTGRTIQRHVAEFLNHFAIRALSEVAGAAGLLRVGRCEGKCRGGMVKSDRGPVFIVVAIFASLFRVIFRIHHPRVDVFMAVDAPDADVAEAPSFRFL